MDRRYDSTFPYTSRFVLLPAVILAHMRMSEAFMCHVPPSARPFPSIAVLPAVQCIFSQVSNPGKIARGLRPEPMLHYRCAVCGTIDIISPVCWCSICVHLVLDDVGSCFIPTGSIGYGSYAHRWHQESWTSSGSLRASRSHLTMFSNKVRRFIMPMNSKLIHGA